MDGRLDIQAALIGLRSLAVFRNLLDDPTVIAFEKMLGAIDGKPDSKDIASSVATFMNILFSKQACWSDYLLDLVLKDFNSYVSLKVKDLITPSVLDDNSAIGRSDLSSQYRNPQYRKIIEDNTLRELKLLERLSQISFDDILSAVAKLDDNCSQVLRECIGWTIEEKNYVDEYRARIDDLSTHGYGIFTDHVMFTLCDGSLRGVKHPDKQRLEDLFGYEQQRQKVIDNTEALLNNLPAVNVLLYGDAGTGKSSTVKAIANRYFDRGLRLVEIKKDQLGELDSLTEQLATNPLKFIIFIDDLSFSSDDPYFSTMKAILEGSTGGHADNVVIYATSNRRHLVKETSEDRSEEDMHASDTRQELTSLSARFGLTITFYKPGKAEYAEIVLELAKVAGLKYDEESLISGAEAYAIRCGGRSPRAAKRYIELMLSGVGF